MASTSDPDAWDRIDPTFTALPYRRLAEVALAGPGTSASSHADFRFERIRYQYLAVRDGRSRAPRTARTSASRSG